VNWHAKLIAIAAVLARRELSPGEGDPGYNAKVEDRSAKLAIELRDIADTLRNDVRELEAQAKKSKRQKVLLSAALLSAGVSQELIKQMLEEA
jgi:hypothetical protein